MQFFANVFDGPARVTMTPAEEGPVSTSEAERALVDVLQPFVLRMHCSRRVAYLIRQFVSAPFRVAASTRSPRRLGTLFARDFAPQLLAYLWIRAGVFEDEWPLYALAAQFARKSPSRFALLSDSGVFAPLCKTPGSRPKTLKRDEAPHREAAAPSG